MNAAEELPAIEIDPERLAGWMAEDPRLQVVDVREPYEREAGRIEPSAHIQLTELAERASSLEGDGAIVFYCRVGNRSLMAAQAFRASGFEAYSLQGGLVRWVGEGRPLSPEGGYVADH